MTLPTSVSASITTRPGPNPASAWAGRFGRAGCAGRPLILRRPKLRVSRKLQRPGRLQVHALPIAPAARVDLVRSLAEKAHPSRTMNGTCRPIHALTLHNSLTRRKERFVPLDPNHVRMYVCGPTVYDLVHVGNARPVVVYDVLARLLRKLYPRVTYVRNITAIEYKINSRAQELGEPIAALTARTIVDYHADVAALGALPPDVEPRATQHIEPIIAIIERLIA